MVECIAKWLALNKKTGLACMAPLQGFKGLNLEKDALYEHLESLDLFQHYFTAAMERIINPHIGRGTTSAKSTLNLNLLDPDKT